MSRLLALIFVTLFSIVYCKRFYITSHGVCSDCQLRGTTYRCFIGKNDHDEDIWDHCSRNPGETSSLTPKKCLTECKLRDNVYRCLVNSKNQHKEDSWGYCSLIEDVSVKGTTYKGNECENFCNIVKPANVNDPAIYKCLTRDYNGDFSYDECSFVNQIDSYGKECVDSCAGKTSTKCRNTEGTSTYCSENKKDPNFSVIQPSNPNKCEVIYQVIQQLPNQERLVTSLFVQKNKPDPDINFVPRANDPLRIDALKVLHLWHKDMVPGACPIASHSSSSSVTSFGRIRLDVQGGFDISPFGRFTNFQLQINNTPAKKSTIAQLNIVYDKLSCDFARRMGVAGLTESLKRGVKTWVAQERLQPSQNVVQCPRNN